MSFDPWPRPEPGRLGPRDAIQSEGGGLYWRDGALGRPPARRGDSSHLIGKDHPTGHPRGISASPLVWTVS